MLARLLASLVFEPSSVQFGMRRNLVADVVSPLVAAACHIRTMTPLTLLFEREGVLRPAWRGRVLHHVISPGALNARMTRLTPQDS